MVRYSIQVALLLLVAYLAWRRGGKPEKQVASILGGMHAINLANALFGGGWTDYSELPGFRIALDALGLLLITYVAVTADRWWPLWVASLQLVTVLAHVLRLIDAQLPQLIYIVMERWPFWAMIVVTGLGTLQYLRRKAREIPGNT